MHGTSDVGSKDIAMALQKAGLKSKDLDVTAEDKALAEDQQMFTREGDKAPSLLSSVVPTIEEKIVAEHRPPLDRVVDNPIQEQLETRDTAAPSSIEARTETGAPANASSGSQHDDQPPLMKGDVSDTSEEESKTPAARAALRKHLAAKTKPWVLPTPAPRVDPNGFEDPICDAFWKSVWLACAAHNVSRVMKVNESLLKCLSRPKSIAKSSMPFLTI